MSKSNNKRMPVVAIIALAIIKAISKLNCKIKCCCNSTCNQSATDDDSNIPPELKEL